MVGNVVLVALFVLAESANDDWVVADLPVEHNCASTVVAKVDVSLELELAISRILARLETELLLLGSNQIRPG